MWYSTNVGVSFQNFRDTVVAQTAQVLMNRGSSRSLNAVVDGDNSEDFKKILAKNGNGADNEEELLEDLFAGIDARRGRGRSAGGRPPQRAQSEPRGGASDGARPPRKCPNCGDTHTHTHTRSTEVPQAVGRI